MSTKKTFRTTDLYFAAYCKAVGVEYLGGNRIRNKVHFEFGGAEREDDLRHAYFSREGSVSAADYADEIRALKSVIHNA